MIIVKAIYFDDDDHNVAVSTIPCDSMETAKALSEKILEKIIDKHSDEDDRQEYIENNVERVSEHYIFVEGYECGYAKILIQDTDPMTIDELASFEPKIYSF